jgi:catechol 2,3-dioxygenase-like lactoylglutathione lyase family enzyme
MGVRRIVPTIASSRPDLCREFYSDLLGLHLAMDLGWIATYVSPTNPTAQISVARAPDPGTAPPSVSVTIEVEDASLVHRHAVERGYPITYPLTDEPWGVKRFAVTDPNGVVINIMCHNPPPARRSQST